MVLELFLNLHSPPCRTMYIFARKNDIPFELRPLKLHLKLEILKVNPLGKNFLPRFVPGKWVLPESGNWAPSSWSQRGSRHGYPLSPAPRLWA
uniref:GST N-terminal domain-containing protein n=1 Tax=Rhinolophus ferrumequinum TaxID=59479 RepID=A0A671FKG5_RHIFE